MNPQNALEILNQVCAAVQTSRETHKQIERAVSILQHMIDSSTEQKDEVKKEE